MGEARKTSLKEAMTWLADTFRMFMGSTEKMTLSDMAANVGQVYNVGREAGVIEGESSGWVRGLTEGIELGKEEGKQAEKKAFWDDWQWDGTRTDYFNACRYWKFSSFRPGHDLYPTNASNMFAFSEMPFSLIEELEQAGKVLDTSNATDIAGIFWSADFTETPEVKAVKCKNINNVYYNCYSMKKATLTIEADVTSAVGTFSGCNALEDFTLNGTLPISLDLSPCIKMSRNGFYSVFNAMSTTVTGQTLTVSQRAVNAAFTEEEWNTLTATRPNWSIVYKT